MKNPRLDLYIWPGDSKEKEDIHNFQGSLQVKMDIKAAIGAGASGLLPELNLLLIAGATLLTAGFLNAVGADGWKLIKKGVVKLATRKPSKKNWKYLFRQIIKVLFSMSLFGGYISRIQKYLF